jgi:hypothetical protein
MYGRKKFDPDTKTSEHDNEKQEENIDENEDYIDWDYSEYEYEELLDFIEEDWVNVSENRPYPLSHFNNIANIIKPVNIFDSFLEIICPPNELLTICGYNQSDIEEEFNPDLFTRPHFFTIRCMVNASNALKEIPSTTIIDITKINHEGKEEKLYQEFYGDLSPIIDGQLKGKNERYYFPDTILLQEGEKMVFRASVRDISEVELFMMCDRFRKKE